MGSPNRFGDHAIPKPIRGSHIRFGDARKVNPQTEYGIPKPIWGSCNPQTNSGIPYSVWGCAQSESPNRKWDPQTDLGIMQSPNQFRDPLFGMGIGSVTNQNWFGDCSNSGKRVLVPKLETYSNRSPQSANGIPKLVMEAKRFICKSGIPLALRIFFQFGDQHIQYTFPFNCCFLHENEAEFLMRPE